MDENLKIGGWDDYNHILQFTNNFFQSSPYRDIVRFDEGKIAQYIMEFIEASKLERIIILALDSITKEPIGMVAGLISEVPFSSDKVATEQVWYIEPQYRNTRTSIKLVEAFEYWAREITKADVVLMSSLNNNEQEKVDRFYTRKGYTLCEKGYVKGLN